MRATLMLAGPIVLNQVGHMSMGIVDTVVAGTISTTTLAGLGLAAGSAVLAAGLAVPFFSAVAVVWARGRRLAAQVVTAFDRSAADMDLVACPSGQ